MWTRCSVRVFVHICIGKSGEHRQMESWDEINDDNDFEWTTQIQLDQCDLFWTVHLRLNYRNANYLSLGVRIVFCYCLFTYHSLKSHNRLVPFPLCVDGSSNLARTLALDDAGWIHISIMYGSLIYVQIELRLINVFSHTIPKIFISKGISVRKTAISKNK